MSIVIENDPYRPIQVQSPESGWAAICSINRKYYMPLDEPYVDQHAVSAGIDALCARRGIPDFSLLVQLVIYLDWREHLLQEGCLLHVGQRPDGRKVITKAQRDDLPWLGHVEAYTYEFSTAKVGDAINLRQLIRKGMNSPWISAADWQLLKQDRKLPQGRISWGMTAREVRKLLAELVKSQGVRPGAVPPIEPPETAPLEHFIWFIAEQIIDLAAA